MLAATVARPVSRLFHAVVVVGASLSACGASEDPAGPPAAESTTTTPTAAQNPEARSGAGLDTDDGAESDSAADAVAGPTADAVADSAAVEDAGAGAAADQDADADTGATAEGGSDTAADSPPSRRRRTARGASTSGMTPGMSAQAARGDACPPGSERPFPPCYYIL
jgi:hypothetical protein